MGASSPMARRPKCWQTLEYSGQLSRHPPSWAAGLVAGPWPSRDSLETDCSRTVASSQGSAEPLSDLGRGGDAPADPAAGGVALLAALDGAFPDSAGFG